MSHSRIPRWFAGAILASACAAAAQESPTADPAAPALQPAAAAVADLADSPPTGAPEAALSAAPASAGPLLPSDPRILQKIVQELSPPNRRLFAEMLSADWNDAPEWAVMMMALLHGEPMGPGSGWYRPSQKRFDWNWLASKFDKNGDGVVDRAELPENAPFGAIAFQRLDRDADGRVRAVDFDYLSRQPATPPLMMSQFLTQLLDGDTNGRITIGELQELIARADKDQTGFLTIEDLQRDFTRAFSQMSASSGEEMPSPDEFVRMFFNGELGTMESGPELGETGPDFTLPTHDGSRSVTLTASRGKPVVLIFGSFT